jgi:hypothetical protein
MSRRKVVFIRAYSDNVIKCKVGERMQMRTEKANDLIDRKIVKIYDGPWPPKPGVKSRINLKDLK